MPPTRKAEPTEAAIVKQIAKFLESLGAKVLKTSGSSTGLTRGTPDVFACVPVRGRTECVFHLRPFDDDPAPLNYDSRSRDVAMPDALFLALEVKRPSKRSAVTVVQRKQLLDWRTAGAIAGVVTSVDDVRELLGLTRGDT